MTRGQELLIEIGTEELPPLVLQTLTDSFAENLLGGLQKLGYELSDYECFATPRRLGVLIRQVPAQQAAQIVKRRGPASKAAFTPDGKATKAAEGFARSCGVEISALSTVAENGDEYLYFETTREGEKTEDLIIGLIEQALKALPIPKRMRWGGGDIEFIRPLHWVMVLYAGTIVEGSVFGIATGRETKGHRVYCENAIIIADAKSYESSLYEQGKVVASYAKRKAMIKQQVEKLSKQIDGNIHWAEDEALLDEVTALVEWPAAFIGSFDDAFLDVPQEVLVMSMKENQKYFPVFDQSENLSRYFIGVANIVSSDEDKVRTGNERVLRPRLADAKFFWEQDKKTSLSERTDALKGILFQSKLGSIYDKSLRISSLAATIAATLGADVEKSRRAGLLCKADLVTDMVGEFPKLQGIMGRYYALASGEPDELALAIEQHYCPRYSGDKLPQSALSQSVALADKLDSLVGIFAANEKPSGDKDPYALRRAAIGLIRIIIDCALDLDLAELIHTSAQLLQGVTADKPTQTEVLDFILNRLRNEYEEAGFSPQQIQSVLIQRPTNLLEFDLRIKAVKQFESMPEALSLSAANKRIRNILKKAGLKTANKVKSKLLSDAAERELHQQILDLSAQVVADCDTRDYAAALKRLSSLKQPVDRFFDEVMVMVDDETLRMNRLALLSQLQNLFLKVADISQLQS